jgi:hypothetical protein
MERVWHKITNHATIMTWANQIVTVGGSIFILPLLLKKFDEIEISFWFLINVFIQLTILADSGFGPTLIRAVSYFKAGASQLPKNKKEFENSKTKGLKPNFEKLLDLLSTSNRIYIFVSWGAVFLMCTVGILITWNIFSLSSFRIDFILSYILIIVNSYFILQNAKWKSFMIGLDYVAKISRFQTVLGSLRLISYITILLFVPNILYLIIFNLLGSLSTLLFLRNFVRKWFINHGYSLEDLKQKFNKRIFESIWAATWKMGGIQWGNYLINYGASIIIAQINNTTLMANFLFTQRLIFIFRRISEVPFYANIQKVYKLMSKKDYFKLKKSVSRYIFLSLIILVTSLGFTGIFGNWFLSILHIETRLVSSWIYLFLSLSIIFEIHASMHRNIYISTNHIPFLLPIIISGIFFIILGFLAFPLYGLMGVVIIQFLVQLSCNYWYPVFLSFRLINWRPTSYLLDLQRHGFMTIYFRLISLFKKNRPYKEPI